MGEPSRGPAPGVVPVGVVPVTGGPSAVGRPVVVGGEAAVDLEAFVAACAGAPVVVAEAAVARARRGEAALAGLLAAGATVYGVTTGYGPASGHTVEAAERPGFQLATVRSHACGSGPALPFAVARGIWLAKLCSLSTGAAGASARLLAALAALLNAGLAPVVPESGSLGASGDLVPSGHAGLVLVGEGAAVTADGRLLEGGEALAVAGLRPVELGPRDGLSLVNGTAASCSLAAHACAGLERLCALAEVVAAAGLEAVDGHLDAFSAEVVAARPHRGVAEAAAAVRVAATPGAEGGGAGGRPVHDPYAWRCVPQVHGAARSAAGWVRGTCETELASCTDNPLLSAGGGIVSGGNFHGAPLGLAMDTALLAVGQVAALSRQRAAHLSAAVGGGPEGGLGPVMLLTSATAALLEITSAGTATNHWLPVDGVEDHVANSAAAGLHVLAALERARHVLSCEVLCVAAVLDARRAPPRSRAARLVAGLAACPPGPAGPGGEAPAARLAGVNGALDGLLAALAP